MTLDVFDNSIAQSKAESPPPKMQTVLSLKTVLSLIEYSISFPTNLSISFVGNFLGSNEPTPAAIIILDDSNSVPLLVFVIHFFSTFLISSTLSFK